MPLKKCRECDNKVSTEATVCPHCGVPNPIPPPGPSQQGGCFRVLVGLAVVAVVIWLAASLSGRRAAARLRAANEHAHAVARARQDSLRGLLKNRRGYVFAHARQLADSGSTLAAESFLNEFAFAGDSGVAALRDSLRAQRLLARLRTVPASDFGRNAAFYDTLRKLEPNVHRYGERYTYYRRKANAQAAALKRSAEIATRRVYAKTLENNLLDKGMDVKVTTRGRNATTLHLQYVLFNRVWSHKFSEDAELMGTIQKLGFKRLEMSDGYDFDVYWTFK